MPINEINSDTNATDTPILTTVMYTTDEINTENDRQSENSTDEAISGTVPTYDNESANTEQKYPHFHVTYWMFYPYSQVKFKLLLLFLCHKFQFNFFDFFNGII